MPPLFSRVAETSSPAHRRARHQDRVSMRSRAAPRRARARRSDRRPESARHGSRERNGNSDRVARGRRRAGHAGADRTIAEPAAQEIDHESEAESFGPAAGSSMPLMAAAGSVVGLPRNRSPNPPDALPRGGRQANLAHGSRAQRHVRFTGNAPAEGSAIAIGLLPTRPRRRPARASADACSRARCRRSFPPPSCAHNVRRFRNESRCARRPTPCRSPARAQSRA